jgi:hypothetical protein
LRFNFTDALGLVLMRAHRRFGIPQERLSSSAFMRSRPSRD